MMLKLNNILAVMLIALMASPAISDSCWDHNGSIMRLKAEGNNRFFSYDMPREGMRREGVPIGQILFNGTKDGNWYRGMARVFNRNCPAHFPMQYFVEGPVLQNPLRIEVSGGRPVVKNCQITGEFTRDWLLFGYIGNC